MFFQSTSLVVDVKGEQVAVQVTKKAGSYQVVGPHGSVEVKDNFTLADSVISTQLNGAPVTAQLIKRDAAGQLRIRFKGTALECRVLPAGAAQLLGVMPVKVPIDTSRTILSPMPGVVKVVAVSVGDKVGEGQECAVVEAMKMQNSLSSGVTGVVKVRLIKHLNFAIILNDLHTFQAVHVKPGDTVDEDQVMVEIV